MVSVSLGVPERVAPCSYASMPAANRATPLSHAVQRTICMRGSEQEAGLVLDKSQRRQRAALCVGDAPIHGSAVRNRAQEAPCMKPCEQSWRFTPSARVKCQKRHAKSLQGRRQHVESRGLRHHFLAQALSPVCCPRGSPIRALTCRFANRAFWTDWGTRFDA
jgi:hypothetical protein